MMPTRDEKWGLDVESRGEGDEYKELDVAYFKERMRERVLVDGRNLYDVNEFQKAGFEFRGIGIGV